MFPTDLVSTPQQELLDPTWSTPEIVSAPTGRAVTPAVIPGPDGVVHLLWEQNGRVHHAVRRAGKWSPPRSIATGQRPAGGLAPNGALHAVFSNEFAGAHNIFHVAWVNGVWSLPRLVSKTPGLSTSPSLAVDRAGGVHAVWADTSPGFSLIYYGWLQTSWLNEPLSNARGGAPVLALDGAGETLHVAYQASGISSPQREIHHLQGRRYQWSLPENLSRSPEHESLGVAMACAPDGSVHVAWQEHVGETAHIRYVSGRQGAWHAPQTVSDLAVDSREPRLTITQERQLSMVWRTSDTLISARRELPAGVWLPARPLVTNLGGLDGQDLAGAPGGEQHLAWSGWDSNSARAVFHSEHGPLNRPKVFFPGIIIGGR
ncbi:MAG: hypothetical protein IAE85_15690 [Anaerolinea sp.]|nr:hypothetical protein [Anaerolinea sp.]